jgi:hypothetical protein
MDSILVNPHIQDELKEFRCTMSAIPKQELQKQFLIMCSQAVQHAWELKEIMYSIYCNAQCVILGQYNADR